MKELTKQEILKINAGFKLGGLKKLDLSDGDDCGCGNPNCCGEGCDCLEKTKIF